MTHDSNDLIELFNSLFESSHNTVLVRGGAEPLYCPERIDGGAARIEFAHGYFASALHEVAHWCLAGAQRRQLVDYGYWYHEDGRSAQKQAEFERVEVKPQALEWIFSVASGSPFRVSLDNLAGGPHDGALFRANIVNQVRQFLEQGLPERARLFASALQVKYAGDLTASCFTLDVLQ